MGRGARGPPSTKFGPLYGLAFRPQKILSPTKGEAVADDHEDVGLPAVSCRIAATDKYAPSQVLRALAASGGVLAEAARMLKCDRRTVMHYMAKYPELQVHYEDIVEKNLDIAETNLLKAVRKGEPWALKFFLGTKGKDRGYSERRELTGAEGRPLNPKKSTVVVQLPDNGRDQRYEQIVDMGNVTDPPALAGPEGEGGQ